MLSNSSKIIGMLFSLLAVGGIVYALVSLKNIVTVLTEIRNELRKSNSEKF